MGTVKQAVSDLARMLNRRQKEASRLSTTVNRLENYLREEPKRVISFSLFLLLSKIEVEAAKRSGSVVVIVSPEEKVTVGDARNMDSDSWLKRLRSQGFSILSLEEFSSFVRSLELEVAQGNYMPAIKFLRANAEFDWTPVYSPSPAIRKAEQPREPSTPSEWKLSDWLPAPPPHPPLPRGLFKD